MTEAVAFLVAVGGLLLFLVVCWLVTRPHPQSAASRAGPLGLTALKNVIGSLIGGKDGPWSTSKLQWLLWTGTIIFAYVAVFTARAMQGHHEAVSDIPPNVLLVLGFSAGTMTVAKGITSAYVANGRVAKTGSGGLLADDGNATDLSKVQLVSWTVIAIGIYIYTAIATVHSIANPPAGTTKVPGLPDIDGALMVLTGLSQGGYLGKKLVSATAPQLTSLTPSSATTGQSVVLTGSGFGDDMGTNVLCLDDIQIAVAPDTSQPPKPQWTDTKIGFVVPTSHPSGNAFTPNQIVKIGVYVNGQAGTSTLPLVVY